MEITNIKEFTEVQSDAIKPFAGFEPRVGEILADVRYEIGPVGSRLPLRGGK